MACLLGAAFLVGSLIWLHLDRGVPVFDGGMHISFALGVRDQFVEGHPFYGLTEFTNYPPLVHLVGAAGLLVGGLTPDAPVAASLIVFVPLLAGGCYVAGRVAYTPLAGVLAVVFALGSPMLVAQIRVFMIDAPETALVAASMAALLASNRFERWKIAAVAGALCGLGLMTKQSFAAFVAGLVLVLLLRGGWRQRRGLLAFAVPLLVVAGPWYVGHFDELRDLSALASNVTPSSAPGAIQPPRWSTQNAGWYVWGALNFELLVPLAAFTAAGTVAAVARFARHPDSSDYTPELVAGLFVGWLGMSWQAVHDPRYMLPALPYFALLGAGWIARLPRRPRVVLAALLVVVAAANTLGDTFGVGRRLSVALPGAPLDSPLRERQLTFYSDEGYGFIGAPRRQRDMVEVMRGLRANGFTRVDWSGDSPEFSYAGLVALAGLARLDVGPYTLPAAAPPTDAYLYQSAGPLIGGRGPCLRLYNGAPIWISRGNPEARRPDLVCPR